MQRCDDCASWIWTPYPACTTCASERLTWTAASARGVLYSYTIVHRPQTEAFEPGYVVAIVHLEEGPRMLTRLVDVAPDDVVVGMPVEVAFEPVDDELALYPSRPATAPARS
jgi:uncharacterized OB-fold protein